MRGSTTRSPRRQPAHSAPENRQAKGPRAPDDMDAAALEGMGPRWRIVAQAVGHARCPSCGVDPTHRCLGPGTHANRVYAHAAALRRERRPLSPERVAELHHALHSAHDHPDNQPTPADLQTAIAHGLVRLFLTVDGIASWVDA